MCRRHLLLILDSRQPLDPGVLLRRSAFHAEAFGEDGLHLLAYVAVYLDCLSGLMVEPVDYDVRVMVLLKIIGVWAEGVVRDNEKWSWRGVVFRFVFKVKEKAATIFFVTA